MEWNDPEGMAWIFRENPERIKWNSLEKGTEKKELSGRKDLQKSINRACTYLRKESKLVPSISEQKVRT